MKGSVCVALAFASAVGAQSVQQSKKTDCRLPRYQPQAPALADLNLEEAEKREIVQLVQEGRKIQAIFILRKCRDLSLKEQKKIIDAVQ
jgi:ribosomal protein L7/L12